MIKALFFDLDGTLLTSEKTISPRTLAVLHQCRQKGIKLFITTARPPLLKRMLNLEEGVVDMFEGGGYYNGGFTIVEGVEKYIFIQEDILINIIDTVRPYEDLNIALQMEQGKHAFRYKISAQYCGLWGISSEETLSLAGADLTKTIKCIIFRDNLVDAVTVMESQLIAQLESVCKDKAQLYSMDGGTAVQITGRSVHKYGSVETIRRRLGYEIDEIAVFGDDNNDAEMLSAYPYSFAMGNAEAHIKAIAGYVTKTNDDDGVAYAIDHILHLLQ